MACVPWCLFIYKFMVLNMLSEHMTVQQVLSLILNLGNALALNLESRCSWGQHIWILSSLENLSSDDQQTTMVTHHLIAKNCNHFSDDTCYSLTGKRIPKWVNRLARVGSLCNCILPEALKASTVHVTNVQNYDSGKRRLRSSFNCLSSISMRQGEREVSISSLFLHSHYKGCLPPWESKKSRSSSLKEG